MPYAGLLYALQIKQPDESIPPAEEEIELNEETVPDDLFIPIFPLTEAVLHYDIAKSIIVKSYLESSCDGERLFC